MTVETCVKRMEMEAAKDNKKEAEFWRKRGLGKIERHPKEYFGKRKEKLLKALKEEPKEEPKKEVKKHGKAKKR